MRNIFDKKYRKLCKTERSAYKKFRGVLGLDRISSETRDQEHAKYLSAKAARIEYRGKNKTVERKEQYETKLVLN